MDNYIVLLVEDQTSVQKICRDAFPEGEGQVRLLAARTLDEARSAIINNFIHIALVDIGLDDDIEHDGDTEDENQIDDEQDTEYEDASKNQDGLGVLSQLCKDRPTCSRYAYTIRSDYTLRNYGMGRSPLAQGVLPKMLDRTEVDFIRDKAREWLAHPVNVDGLDDVLAEICRKMQPPHPLRDELDYLVSKIFGQGGVETSIRSIELKLLDGGRSRSVVALGQPKDGSGRAGIWTVIKFSKLLYAKMEHEAYCKHVRFMLPVSQRVELLGYFEADTLGAMCYSFAGGAPRDEIVSLERLIHDEDSSTFEYLTALHEPLGTNWYSLNGETLDQAQYVAQRYEVNADAVRERIHTFGKKLALKLEAGITENGIRLGNHIIDWPTARDLGNGQLRQRPQCIIHGDLHAGNILIRRGTGQAVLIDHQYTGPGPAHLDFAALDASSRLFTRTMMFSRQTLEDQVITEAKVWNAVWNAPIDSAVPDELPFWARVSFSVVMLARKSFPDLTPKDYAGTCLLWALRVFKIDKLDEVPRVQLFIWISHLLKVLRASR